jgi:MFS transporter, DHA1 family, multidrug resistance protein
MHEETLRSVGAPTVRAGFGLVLGVLSAIGPLAIDLYLPALPTMARDLQTVPGEVQRTLSLFFLALAVAQVPIGVFSDRYGRKLALYVGLGLFCLASVACAFAVSIGWLQALRFVQGFGVCAGTVVSRAMIRDMASGPAAAKLMAVSFLIIGLSPVCAPLVGNALLTVMPWRGLFLVMAATGVCGLLLVRFAVPESVPNGQQRSHGTSLATQMGEFCRNSRFWAGALGAGLSMTVPYAYVTAAPFVFSGGFHIDSHAYSMLLAISAASSIASMQFAPSLMKRWGAGRVLFRAAGSGVVLCLFAVAAWAAGRLSLPVFQIVSMLLFIAAGLMLTPAAVTALDAAKGGAGTAASLVGTTQLAVTAVASSALSWLPPFSVLPLLSILAIALALAMLLGRSLLTGSIPKA